MTMREPGQPDRPPDYIPAMVRRLPPAGAPVVPRSTPVVAFGDVTRAEVATLGINPSANEFLERGRLLEGDDRRLATLDSLGAGSLDQLSEAQIAAVIRDCATHFDRKPYRKWFDPLDKLLRAGVGASYCDGSACHLDLVQWATDPVWGQIPDRDVQRALLEDGVPYLRTQLETGNVRLILINGRAVIDQVRTTAIAEIEKVGELPLGHTTCSLYCGTGANVRWAGWSANLQSGFGISNAFKQDLGHWLARWLKDA